MGNQQSEINPYSITPDLSEHLTPNTWQTLLNHRSIRVNFAEKQFNNPFRRQYTITIDNQIPRNAHLTLIIPHHPVEKKRFLQVHKYSKASNLAQELNTRLMHPDVQRVHKNDYKLVVACGNFLYTCVGLQGTVYLICAENVNQISYNQCSTQVTSRVPILVEMNGKMQLQSIFVFPSEPPQGDFHTLPLADVKLQIYCDDVIFSCEQDVRRLKVQDDCGITTISASEAAYNATNTIVKLPNKVSRTLTPFASVTDAETYDDEDDELILMGINDESSGSILQLVTPRDK